MTDQNQFLGLGINFAHSIQEEFDISDTSKQSSKRFDFRNVYSSAKYLF